jgi:hypothetical protein
MNFVKKLSLFLTATFAASTVICGCSIAAQPVVEASSIQFHMGFAAATLLLSILSIALFARQTKKA